MSKWYCHNCGAMLCNFPNYSSSCLTGSAYQLDKFMKHTVPTNNTDLVSVFGQADYNKYKDYLVNTCLSGSVEIDDQQRTNVVWYAGTPTGYTLVNGIPQAPVDCVKVVLMNNSQKVHAYPTGSIAFALEKCAACGADIIK